MFEFKCFLLRQQFYSNEDKNLANLLNLEPNVTKSYDIYVTELMDGNISGKDENGFKEATERRKILSIVLQLMNGLEQLEIAGKSHNDIKPSNILYSHELNNDDEYDTILKISDFGQCQRSGGTPGWTPPIFQGPRVPGKSDMYSMALVILYILCESADTFYWLRDNCIKEAKSAWLTKFRSFPEINLIMKMMDLNKQPSISNCRQKWIEILNNDEFEMITSCRLQFIPKDYLEYQSIFFEKNTDQNLTPTEYQKNEYTSFQSEETDTCYSDELSVKEK